MRMQTKQIAIIILVSLLCISATAGDSERDEIEALTGREEKMINSNDFDSLEAMAEELLSSKARFSSGSWKLINFYRQLGDSFNEIDWRNKPEVEGKILAMVSRHPNSRNALLIYATALEYIAWQYRGEGLASTVTEEGWKGFRENMGKARNILEKNKALLVSNPEWYAHRVFIAGATGEGTKNMLDIFSEGAKKEPTYKTTFYTAFQYLGPKWGGSFKAMREFIKNSVNYPSPVEGISMYANLVRIAEDGRLDNEIVKSPEIDQLTLRRSITDVMRVYPTESNAQSFLYLACMKGDKEETKYLATLVKGEPSESDLVRPVRTFNDCVNWATKNKMFVHKDLKTGKVRLYGPNGVEDLKGS